MRSVGVATAKCESARRRCAGTRRRHTKLIWGRVPYRTPLFFIVVSNPTYQHRDRGGTLLTYSILVVRRLIGEDHNMQVREIMTANPTCCTPESTLQQVAEIMATEDCGC